MLVEAHDAPSDPVLVSRQLPEAIIDRFARNRDVALKVISDTFALDPDRVSLFTREAQVLASA